MELVAKDLKSMGLYLARSVSYDGVDYRTFVHDLESHQAQTYDRCAQAWQVVLRNIQDALEVTKADKCGRARAAAYSQFWGAHQRFFLHVLVAMSAPSLIRDMEARLAAGESCVVQLVSTMEAATERAYAKAVKNGEDLRDLDVTPRDQLLQFVEASFPTTLYEEYLDDDGRVSSRPVKNAAGDFVQSPEAVAARNRLMLEVGAVSVPHGVLDQVVAHFGPDAVAEVTGRSRRFVTKTVDGIEQVVEERRTRRTCNAEADEFMAGKRRVLVFSQAGGTGRSYHADLAADNQQRRVLYCVEPGWSQRAVRAGHGPGPPGQPGVPAGARARHHEPQGSAPLPVDDRAGGSTNSGRSPRASGRRRARGSCRPSSTWRPRSRVPACTTGSWTSTGAKAERSPLASRRRSSRSRWASRSWTPTGSST